MNEKIKAYLSTIGSKGGKSKSIKKMRAFKKNSKLRWSGKGVK